MLRDHSRSSLVWPFELSRDCFATKVVENRACATTITIPTRSLASRLVPRSQGTWGYSGDAKGLTSAKRRLAANSLVISTPNCKSQNGTSCRQMDHISFIPLNCRSSRSRFPSFCLSHFTSGENSVMPLAKLGGCRCALKVLADLVMDSTRTSFQALRPSCKPPTPFVPLLGEQS